MKSVAFPRLVLVLSLAALGAGSTGCAAEADETSTGEDDATGKGRFTRLAKPTDADLAALHAVAKKIDGAYLGVQRFNKRTTEGTDPAAREKRIKEVMHRYMCGFFDESIDIGRNTKTDKTKQALDDLDFSNTDTGVAPKALEDALRKAYANPKLDILSGSASGNNTVGNVLGVYDVAHDEVLFFGFTNCGSDS